MDNSPNKKSLLFRGALSSIYGFFHYTMPAHSFRDHIWEEVWLNDCFVGWHFIHAPFLWGNMYGKELLASAFRPDQLGKGRRQNGYVILHEKVDPNAT